MADDEKRIVTKKATAKPEAARKTVSKKAGTKKVVAKTAGATGTTARKPPVAAKKVVARATKKTAVEKAAAPATAAKPASSPASGRTPAAARPAATTRPMPNAAPRSPQSSLPLEERSGATRASGAVAPQERYKMIEEAAYYKAEKRNFDPAFNAQNWAEAEREIDAMLAARRR